MARATPHRRHGNGRDGPLRTRQEIDMLTKISAIAITALVLGTATAASAQSQIGNGLPAEAYGSYGTYAPAPYAYVPAPHHVRTHRRAAEY
jgi:hypothetical protein